ncbi:LON peptidase substrate-binding domain-containing protein [Candidatus Poribacteria bacterium]|nr:LON peptidase substrate-binding domain-containing protein [Candidatus Poribacteria bacterium]
MNLDKNQINEKELPIFPLNVVLFPGGYLPLHIFEQRYREMIKHCIRDESSFGVVMIKDGRETGDSAIPCRVGTEVDLVDVNRFPDGRMNIVTSGHSRFEILEINEDMPYLNARVRILDTFESDADPNLSDVAAETLEVYKEYETLSSFLRFSWQPPDENPEHPQQLAYQIGSRLRLPLNEKQELLELESFDQLLRKEFKILKHLNQQIAFQLTARNN